MAKIIDIKIDEKAPVVVDNMTEKEKFARLIEIYKKQNPIKYEHKKAALEAKLASLK